jgi:MOSC domain-containing protein YiiM
VEHLDLAALEAGVDHARQSPQDDGRVELIIRRPSEGEREQLAEATLDTEDGLVGDRWRLSGSPNQKAQLTLKNARFAAVVAQSPERVPLAGDQLYVDFDLSAANIPPGTRLAIGSAVVEVTDEPHTGCRKYLDRFGKDALKFVNSPVGRALNLRGINARIVVGGVVRAGDTIRKAS